MLQNNIYIIVEQLEIDNSDKMPGENPVYIKPRQFKGVYVNRVIVLVLVIKACRLTFWWKFVCVNLHGQYKTRTEDCRLRTTDWV